jgi:hypothetical protein
MNGACSSNVLRLFPADALSAAKEKSSGDFA